MFVKQIKIITVSKVQTMIKIRVVRRWMIKMGRLGTRNKLIWMITNHVKIRYPRNSNSAQMSSPTISNASAYSAHKNQPNYNAQPNNNPKNNTNPKQTNQPNQILSPRINQ